MAKEIEKKFSVISANLPDLENVKCTRIGQHYICLGEKEETRIRKKGNKFFLTIKGDGTLERNEWEKEISEDLYLYLVPAALGRTVIKDRYEIELPDGKIAELDIYREKLEGPEHVTAEVEFMSEKEAGTFSKPGWFGDEVTDDKRFKNKNLATKGWPVKK